MLIRADRPWRLQDYAAIPAINENTRVRSSAGRILQEIVHGLKMVGKKDIVGIEERNEPSNGSVNPAVASRRAALIFLPQQANTPVSDPLECDCRIVRRTVVDDDDLEILKRLPEYRIQGCLKSSDPVVDRYHHREEGSARCHPIAFASETARA
jgi:hypothetical protein